jgi:hypothetical protein
MKKTLFFLFLLSLSIASVGNARADIVQFTLNNVTLFGQDSLGQFTVPGTASGSFTLNTADDSLSNVNVVGLTTYTAGTFSSDTFTFSALPFFGFSDTYVLTLVVTGLSLTSANPVTGIEERIPSGFGELIQTRLVTGGTLDPAISVIPLPGAFPLFATGLGALGLLGWRRKRKAQAG